MVALDIRLKDSGAVQRRLAELRRNAPMAMVRAVNRIGREVVVELGKEMDRVFDRPTPWAKRGLRQTVASTARPVFRVYLEEFGGKGIAAADFLSAQIEGGPRKHKRFEKALIAKGLMLRSSYAVPGGMAPLDAYGNVSGSFIVRMLADLQAFAEGSAYAMRNRKGKRRGNRKSNYFFVGGRPGRGAHLKPGIYWRNNGLIGCVFLFVSSPSYRKRYDFHGVGDRTIGKVARRIIAEELARITRGGR